MSKYLKVMFGNMSSADNNIHYKVDEINVSDKWNPSADNQKKWADLILVQKIKY